MAEQSAPIRRAFWVDPENDPRDTGELPGDEIATLRQYLDRYRMTFEMKCDGLSPEQMATRSVRPSTMRHLGLVRHLAKIEHHWFRRTLAGRTSLTSTSLRKPPTWTSRVRSGPPSERRTRGSLGDAR